MMRYIFTFILFFIYTHTQGNIIVLNGLTHSFKTEKSKIYSGKIELQNTGNTQKSVKLFLQDLSYNYDGSILYSEPNNSQYSNANWIKLSTNLVNIKPKEKAEVIFEISVPHDVELQGTYWSTIIAEPVEDLNPSTSSGVRVTSVVRYAVQILTDYQTDNLTSEIKFEKIELVKDSSSNILKVALSNQGRIYCKSTASIEIYNSITGEKINKFFSQDLGLLPGNSKTFSIIIPSSVPSGKYKAVLFATDTNDNTFAMNVELNI